MVSQPPRPKRTFVLLSVLATGAAVNGWALWSGPSRTRFASVLPHQHAELKSQMVEAAHRGDGAAVLDLISCGNDVNILDSGGATPLLAAASAGHGHVVRLLVGARAKVDARDASGRTALMLLATRANQDDAIRSLIAANAELDLQDRAGQSALTIAVAARRQSYVAMLLAAGADPTGHLPSPPPARQTGEELAANESRSAN